MEALQFAEEVHGEEGVLIQCCATCKSVQETHQCPLHFLAQSIELSVKSDEPLRAQSVKHSPASLIESVWGGQRALEQLAVLLLLCTYAQPVR